MVLEATSMVFMSRIHYILHFFISPLVLLQLVAVERKIHFMSIMGKEKKLSKYGKLSVGVLISESFKTLALG